MLPKMLIVRDPLIGFSHLAHLGREVKDSLWLLCRRSLRRPTEQFLGFSPNVGRVACLPHHHFFFLSLPPLFWDHLPIFSLHRSPKEKISKDFLWESTLAGFLFVWLAFFFLTEGLHALESSVAMVL